VSLYVNSSSALAVLISPRGRISLHLHSFFVGNIMAAVVAAVNN